MIPSLPFELIKDIIQLSLPPVQYSTYRERYDTLLACSLVSSVWRSVAQEELMKHLAVKDLEGLKLLVKRMRVMKEAGFNIAPITLHLEGDYEVEEKVDIKNCFELCSTIRELFIVKDLFPTELFSSFDWSSLTNLTSLHLVECKTPPPSQTTSFQFPSLTHLTLFDISKDSACDDEYINADFLRQSSFPSLTSINFAQLNTKFSGFLQQIPTEIAQQLTHLAIYDNHYVSSQYLFPTLPQFTSLQSLVLRDTYCTDSLHPISNSLSSISIFKKDEILLESLNEVRRWLNDRVSVPNLKMLRLSSEFQNANGLEDDEAAEVLSQLNQISQAAAGRGIQLDFIDIPEIEYEETWDVIEYLNKLALASKI